MVAIPARFLATVLAVAGAAAASPEVHVESAAGMSRLDVRGVRGAIEMRLGAPGEVRWAATALESPGAGPEIAATASESALRIGPAGEGVRTGCRLEIAVPPGLPVDVETEDGRVSASGLRSPLSVRGSGLDADLRGIADRVAVTIRGGKAALSSVSGDVEIYGTDLAVALAGVGGAVRAGLEGGSLEAREIAGGLDAALTGSTLVASQISGSLVLRARGGTAAVEGLAGDATVEMEGAPLKLIQAKGEIEVVADAGVDLREGGGAARIDASAGLVQVSGYEGSLEIRGARDTRFLVTTVAGPVRLDGQGLRAAFRQLRGGAEIRVADSTVTVDGLEGDSFVDAEGGTLAVSRSADRLTVRSRGGDVRLHGLRGPVDVDADGPRVQVAWAAVPQVEDSSVRNGSGPVEIGLAGPGGCGVEARSRSGKVRAALPGLATSDDGREVSGRFGTGGGASIRVEAEGDVVLRGVGPKERPPDATAR